MMNDDCVTTEERLANARRIAGDNADIAVDTLGKLAVEQERVARVEAVCERWFKRMVELRGNVFKRGIANSYQDLRLEILDALYVEPTLETPWTDTTPPEPDYSTATVQQQGELVRTIKHGDPPNGLEARR